MIEKVRHIVPWGEVAWEIDVFSGDNAGLVIAEVELRDEDQHVDVPAWIGAEVTGQSQYYNSTLVRHPFCTWGSQTADRAGPEQSRVRQADLEHDCFGLKQGTICVPSP